MGNESEAIRKCTVPLLATDILQETKLRIKAKENKKQKSMRFVTTESDYLNDDNCHSRSALISQ
jgi:hypothetical protein